MARIPQVVLIFSSQTITSAGTLVSDTMNLGRDAYVSVHYKLNTATSGTYVSATAQMLVSADKREPFLLPVDTAGGIVGTLCQINSNNQYIRSAFPLAAYGQVRIISSTNNTITFDSVYLVMDEQN
jgi:hypothetical protein